MVLTRRTFVHNAVAALLDHAPPSPHPSCSFVAPIQVLKQAGARIVPITPEKRASQLFAKRLKAYARDLHDILSQEAVQLALPQDYLWTVRDLNVSFLGSVDPLFQQKILTMINDWSQYSGITFHLISSGRSDIRIEIGADGRNWSLYGNLSSAVLQDKPTVHFGSVNEYSSDDDLYRVAVHEFGHSLGAIHEHQSPAATGIHWNTNVVNDYYHGLNWTDEMIKENIYATFPATTTLYTRFDPQSIMIYDFPAHFTTDGMAVAANRVLSDLDKTGMKTLYDQARSNKM